MTMSRCSKSNSATPVTGNLPALINGPLPGGGVLDTSWSLDQVHCGMVWNVPFQNVANTNLTGKFTMFNFSSVGSPNPAPRLKYTAFWFDPNNLSKCYMNFWMQVCTFNTGQPGRDGVGLNIQAGKNPCGLNYCGVVYQDSTKDTVYNAWDTARFISTSFTQSGTGYIVQGNFTFNHYRQNGDGNGCADGTPITKPMTIYLAYNGMNDILTNGGPAGKYWAGFTGTATIDLTQYFDQTATKAYVPQPGEFPWVHSIKKSDLANDQGAAANNKTYGAPCSEVGTTVQVTMNCVFYKTHQ